MAEGQVQHFVDVLAERLGRSVVLDKPDVNLLAASRHYGDADDQRVRSLLQRDVGSAAIGHVLGQGVAQWTAPGYIPPREDLGMKARLCHAVRWQGQLLGYLLVIDEHQSMTEQEIGEVVRAGREIGALLFEELLRQDSSRREQESAVRDLVSAEPTGHQAGMRTLNRLGVLHPAAHVTVTGLQLDDRHGGLETAEVVVALRTATSSVAHSRPGYAAEAVVGERGILLQTWDGYPTAERLRAQASELRDAVGRVLGDGPVPIAGVGRVYAGTHEAHRAYGDALIALRAAARIPALSGLALAEDLGPLGIVLRVPDADLTPELVPRELLLLREADPQGRLVQTLRSYLDHAGAGPATAEALHIHRTSLYYRLQRIEELTGLSLADGRHRLLLHLGLYVLDVVG
ncbi:PucR family transcriptional regulator [Streptomyces sp. NRRL S-813]|uniref:PucR family transcriptional regulator n=1 Tax=Streptomyces sp. NRRL S-813 TaxID=1463919 RepID=UPI0004C06117|nr:helix-turn-helix domain-containing protein [Streptomyces sp. NRRL S-813]